jgi:hypothetical protein
LPDRGREVAHDLSWLAEAHVYDKDIEEAATAALQALHLSASTSSDRVKVVRLPDRVGRTGS